MKITAEYHGAHGSCGYYTGIVYILTATFSLMNEIIIHRQDGDGMCIYSTLNAFLSNWRDVNKLEK